MNDSERNGLQEIIDEALADMAREAGGQLAPGDVNLAELCRRTGLTRSRARALKAKAFRVTPHGRCGMKAETTVLTGFTGVVDGLLRQGVTNSEVIYERIASQGYPGGRTTVKNYIRDHASLVPAKRKVVEPQGSCGRRYSTEPGEAYQMDWGFADAVFMMKGASFRGAELETLSVESAPNALKVGK